MPFKGLKKTLPVEQFSMLRNLVDVELDDQCGEIERHLKMNPIVMCSPGGSVALTA